MKVDIDAVCDFAGKKEYMGYVNGKPYYRVAYPVSKAKSVLKLICEYCEPNVINEVDTLLLVKYPKFHKEFTAIRSKYGR